MAASKTDSTERIVEAMRLLGQERFTLGRVVEVSGQAEALVNHVVKQMVNDSEVRPVPGKHNEYHKYTYTPAFSHWRVMTRKWTEL